MQGNGSTNNNRLAIVQQVAITVLIVIIAAGIYYMLVGGPAYVHIQNATTNANATETPLTPLQYRTNPSASLVNVSPESEYMLNASYITDSTLNYSQIGAAHYVSPIYYGPGMQTAYDSMVANPEFESRISNNASVVNLSAAAGGNILSAWAYTELFNTEENATGMYYYMYQTHATDGNGVATTLSPGIGNQSVLISYGDLQGNAAPLKICMVLFVYKSAFVQIGTWVPRNASVNQTVDVARAYAQKLAQHIA